MVSKKAVTGMVIVIRLMRTQPSYFVGSFNSLATAESRTSSGRQEEMHPHERGNFSTGLLICTSTTATRQLNLENGSSPNQFIFIAVILHLCCDSHTCKARYGRTLL